MKVRNLFGWWETYIYNRTNRHKVLEHPKFITISRRDLGYKGDPELNVFPTLEAVKESLNNKKHDKETEVLIYELKECLKVSFKPEIKSCL